MRASDELKDALHEHMERGETFEDVVWRLLEAREDVEDVEDDDEGEPTGFERDRPPEDHSTLEDVAQSEAGGVEEPGDGLREDLEELDLPGRGPMLEAREDAVTACYQLLEERGQAERRDFLRDVYRDHPAGYDSEGGWWNTVGKRGLGELAERRDDLGKPPEGGRVWQFLDRGTDGSK